jgi:hypothetical protein
MKTMEQIQVGIISNQQGFEKLKQNPLYQKFNLKHLQKAQDVVGGFDLVIRINNPGMIDEGATEAVRAMGLMIWNKAALYEWAKELQN